MRVLGIVVNLCWLVLSQPSVASERFLPEGFMSDPQFKDVESHLNFTITETYGEDFGGIIHHQPLAVFTPPTVEILQNFLQICTKHHIKVSCRGKGHSTYGQSQVSNGISLDLKGLDIPLAYANEDHTSLSVPSYKTWEEVITFTKEENKTVFVNVDYLRLSFGGTLSFAALGGTSFWRGSGADNVLNLDVVTMDGKRYQCSRVENPELFNAVLCGLGQYGIILKATIPLCPAFQKVAIHKITYDDMDVFLKDQKHLYDVKAFEYLKGYAQKKSNAWEYVIEAVSYYDDQEKESVAPTLVNLSSQKSTCEEMLYFDFVRQVDVFVDLLQSHGKLNVPHPWYNVLMPENKVASHLKEVLTSPYLSGVEPIVVYPMNRDHFNQPLFMKPEGQTFYLVGVLYNTSFAAQKDIPIDEILKYNKALYLKAKSDGGSRYPVDAMPFTRQDWKNHYGEKWPLVSSLKEKFDPHHLLSSGVNIFK